MDFKFGQRIGPATASICPNVFEPSSPNLIASAACPIPTLSITSRIIRLYICTPKSI